MTLLDDEKKFYERFWALLSDQQLIEIGSLKGLTAFVLARRFKRVVSVDIAEDRQKYEFAEMLGVKNVSFINIANNAEKARIARSLMFDFAYLDGDHTHDTESDFALVRSCGRVLFHEYWDAQPSVVSLVDRLHPPAVIYGKLALWTA